METDARMHAVDAVFHRGYTHTSTDTVFDISLSIYICVHTCLARARMCAHPGMESRRTVELGDDEEQQNRNALIEKANIEGVLTGYSGVRVSVKGNRINIKDVVLFKVYNYESSREEASDALLEWIGLAAWIRDWDS